MTDRTFLDNARARCRELEAEVERLRDILNTPSLDGYARSVELEAAHQLERWGEEHDRGKEPQDWYWLVGHLAGKALRASIDGDRDKARHHTISTGAVLLHWHRYLTEEGP